MRIPRVIGEQEPVDLTQNNEVLAQPHVFEPQLPFRPKDLERLKGTTDKSPWLNDELLNSFTEYLISPNPHMSTISSGTWDCQDLNGWTLPCHESTTFILPVNIAGKHWVWLRIVVSRCEAVLFDPLKEPNEEKNNETCLQFARRFVTKRLPDPYNDWDHGWHVAGPTKNPQQSNSSDCGVYCLVEIAYTAVGLEVPSFIDSELYRPLLLALATNINFIAVVSRAGQYSEVPVPSMAFGPMRLWDTLSDAVRYQDQLPGLTSEDMDAVSAALASANTLEGNRNCQSTVQCVLERQQQAANSHIAVYVSKLRVLHSALQEPTTLTDTIHAAASSHLSQDCLQNLQHDDTSLKIMLESAKGLSDIDLKDQLEHKIQRARRNIALQRRQEVTRRDRLACLGRAVEKTEVSEAGQNLQNLMGKYLRDHSTHQNCSLS